MNKVHEFTFRQYELLFSFFLKSVYKVIQFFNSLFEDTLLEKMFLKVLVN